MRAPTRPQAGRDGGQRTVSRRRVLATAGATAAGLGGLAATSRPARAAHADEQPGHVTLTADTTWLETYRPALDLRNVSFANRPTLYGWRAESTERDLDVGVYCAEYAVQRDVFTLTSHAGDHEWIYVFVDSDAGEVDHVSYTAYHWLKGYQVEPTMDDGHPTYIVADRYHHYIPSPEGQTDNTVLLDVESLGDDESETGPLYSWLRNGLENDLAKGAVHNPWLLAKDGPLTDWWDHEGTSRVNLAIANLWATFGIFGADVANAGDREL